MVEATQQPAGPKSREEMKAQLAARFQELLAESKSKEVNKEAEGGNIQCKVTWDKDGKVVCIAEMKQVLGIFPEDFKGFFSNWAGDILQVNPILIAADVVDESEGL